MSLSEILPIISACCAVIACACAIVVAVRAGRWRETDDAKALVKRVGDVEGGLSKLQGLGPAIESVEHRVNETESRLDKLEPLVASMATKEDIARLRGEVNAVCQLVDNQVVPGIRRIEDYMLGHGK